MFIDANIFIDSYDRGKKAQECNKFLTRIKRGEQQAVTSPMVLDEVVYVLLNAIGEKLALRAYLEIVALPNLRILQIDADTVRIVPKYIEKGLMPHDAFHAATMRQNKISTICSYDRDFDIIEGIKRQEPK